MGCSASFPRLRALRRTSGIAGLGRQAHAVSSNRRDATPATLAKPAIQEKLHRLGAVLAVGSSPDEYRNWPRPGHER